MPAYSRGDIATKPSISSGSANHAVPDTRGADRWLREDPLERFEAAIERARALRARCLREMTGRLASEIGQRLRNFALRRPPRSSGAPAEASSDAGSL